MEFFTFANDMDFMIVEEKSTPKRPRDPEDTGDQVDKKPRLSPPPPLIMSTNTPVAILPLAEAPAPITIISLIDTDETLPVPSPVTEAKKGRKPKFPGESQWKFKPARQVIPAAPLLIDNGGNVKEPVPTTTEELDALPEEPYPEEILSAKAELILSEEYPYDPLPTGFELRPAQKRAIQWTRDCMENVVYTPGNEDRPSYEKPLCRFPGRIYQGQMGIGKTITALMIALTTNAPNSEDGTSLIVIPPSAIEVFHAEWKKHFAPKEKERRILFFDKNYMTPAAMASFNCNTMKRYKVVVVTYNTLMGAVKEAGIRDDCFAYGVKENGELNKRDKWVKNRLYTDVKHDPNALGRRAFYHFRFASIILDEAQNARNPTSETFIAIMLLYGYYRFCFTGTPFTNTSLDMWSLFRICGYQSILTPSVWRKEGLRRYKLDGLGNALLIHTLVTDAPEIVIPPLVHVQCNIELNGTERAVYKNIATVLRRLIDTGDGGTQYAYLLGLLSYLRRSVIAANLITESASRAYIRTQQVKKNKQTRLNAKLTKEAEASSDSSSSSSSGSSESSDSDSDSSESESESDDSDSDEKSESIVVNSPKLGEIKAEKKEEAAEEQAASEIPEAELLNLIETKVEDSVETLSTRVKDRKGIAGIYSSTMNEFVRLLDKVIPKGEKVLVYSAFGSAIDLGAETLDIRCPDVKYMLFDGTVKHADRVATSRMFSEDSSITVLFVNHKAGGTAHNWQVANHIILIDTWFNRATLEQIYARAHRPGQRKSVTVYTMHRVDTLDDKLCEMRKQKEVQKAAFYGNRISRARNNGTMSLNAIRSLLQ